MTHHDSLDRDLPAWLADDAVRPVPAGLLDAIASATESRRQQPAWLVALRGESMGAPSLGGARTLRIALVVVLCAIVALAAAIASGMLPTQPDRGDPLAFIRDGDLYLAASVGTGAHLALHEEGLEFRTVAWSPAGNKLALQGDSGVVIVFDTRTGQATDVEGYAHSPAWSPDGAALAVLGDSADASDQGIRLLDAESLETRLIHPFGGVGDLAWSPDGRWIAATGGGDRSNAVIRIEVATGEVVEIGAPSGHLDSSKQVRWSPDSQHIAFIKYFDPGVQPCNDYLDCRVDVWVAGADGSNPIRINQTVGWADAPTWSPDGAWVAFRSLAPFGIQIARPDGTDERSVISAPVATLAWTGSGDRILYARGVTPGQSEIWETTQSGEARSLGLRVDTNPTSFSTGLSFDLQATAK